MPFSLRNLVLGYECGRVSPASVGSGLFAYDSITVSSAWELISVSMCYYGFNTSLSRLMYSTHALAALHTSYLLPCVVCGYLPWHGHVLPGTKVIKIMCGHQLYKQG